MDIFSLFGDSFANCLHKLDKVLKRCIECNLTLSWEKVTLWSEKELFRACGF